MAAAAAVSQVARVGELEAEEQRREAPARKAVVVVAVVAASAVATPMAGGELWGPERTAAGH